MSTTASPVATTPAEIVTTFLTALEENDLDRAMALLADDAVWINVSLPTIRGRSAIARSGKLLFETLGGGFRVHFHNVATEGDVVLTERSDAIVFGPVEQRFWVYGRFEVRDGLITVWRDSFDWWDLTVGLVRGVLGAVAPALNRPWPTH